MFLNIEKIIKVFIFMLLKFEHILIKKTRYLFIIMLIKKLIKDSKIIKI